MGNVAKYGWSSELGAHGPIVLTTGVWLVLRRWHLVAAAARPPSTWQIAPAFIILLALYYLSSVTQIIEINGFILYALIILSLTSFVGIKALNMISFPIFYLIFAFPPPESLVAVATQPLKVWISETAVGLLYLFNYPIAGSGVMIQVGQYQLLVAAACSGVNSLISLSAISMFYIYMRHRLDWGYNALMLLAIVPVAIFANLVRVLILILLTYHAGEATAQGFFHDFAGITMFVTAVATIFALDRIARPIWIRASRKAQNGAT